MPLRTVQPKETILPYDTKQKFTELKRLFLVSVDDFVVFLENVSHSELSKPSTNTTNMEIPVSETKVKVKAVWQSILNTRVLREYKFDKGESGPDVDSRSV